MSEMAPSGDLSLNWPDCGFTPEEYLKTHPTGEHALTAKVLTGQLQLTVQEPGTGGGESHPPAPPKEKLAIVGFAPSTRGAAPWGHEDFEIWGLNELWQNTHAPDCPGPWHRWFEIHPVEDLVGSHRDKDHMKWLKEQRSIPIYMQRHEDEIPNSIRYPLEEIIRMFPNGDYLTNSISQMLALALLESVEWDEKFGFIPKEGGFKEIHLYGVDMATDTEYGDQRPSCEYWAGITAAAGIKLFIPSRSDLLKNGFIYGYHNSTKLRAKMRERMEELEQGIGHHSAHELAHRDAKNQGIGGKENCLFVIRNWTPAEDGAVGHNQGENAEGSPGTETG